MPARWHIVVYCYFEIHRIMIVFESPCIGVYRIYPNLYINIGTKIKELKILNNSIK